MKLYQEFIKQIKELGDIKLAWFTSFNIDLYFFEKYILSALNGIEPDQLKSLKDYEVLNEMFHQREVEAKIVDVKVFYDFRANNSKDSKKTCVTTIPVNPNLITSNDRNFKGGVFHPKIALLINQQNEGFILAASANLSISGWAQNSECAVFKKINDKQNAQSIVDFFASFTTEEDMNELLLINRSWQEKLAESDNWHFLSSFQNVGLLDMLQPLNESLYVWSPYFSDELSDIIKKHLNQTELTIIPDIEGGSKVRLSYKTLQSLQKLPNVRITKDLFDFKSESKPFVHAKTWLTSEKIAIGSWNFTQAGLNLGNSGNNIEAGIILNIDSGIFNRFVNSCKLEEVVVYGMSEEELIDERNKSLKAYSLVCQIYADWNNFTYFMQNTEQFHGKNYFVSLPSLTHRVSTNDLLNNRISFFGNYKTLLKDRIFTVFDSREGSKELYVGIINEINTVKRPAVGFENINDLLNAWLSGNPAKDNSKHVPVFKSDDETGEEINRTILECMSGDYSQGWFSMFLAIGNMKKSIDKNQKNEKELRLLGYHLPGSIYQLYEHISLLKSEFESKEAKPTVSAPFLWFLINEGNSVFKDFNKAGTIYKLEKINRIDNIEVKFDIKNKNYTNRKIKKWLQTISEGYYE